MYRPTRRDLFAAPVGLLLAQKLSALPLASIKLGVTTDEIHDDVLTASKFLREHGLKWAEVRNIWGPYNTAQPIEKVREAARIFDENGIRVSIEGTDFHTTTDAQGRTNTTDEPSSGRGSDVRAVGRVTSAMMPKSAQMRPMMSLMRYPG